MDEEIDDVKNLRDVFLQSETEYINELIKKPYYIHLLKRFHNQKPEYLFNLAKDMIKSIELGKIKPQNLDDYEATISILLLCTHSSMRETVKEICKKQREALENEEEQEK